jgi:hypothetical protein
LVDVTALTPSWELQKGFVAVLPEAALAEQMAVLFCT